MLPTNILRLAVIVESLIFLNVLQVEESMEAYIKKLMAEKVFKLVEDGDTEPIEN